MRLNRSWSIVFRLLLLSSAAGALRGQTTVSLGASSNGSSAGCALSGGQTCTLTARVTGLANSAVTFTFSPTVAGVTIGTPTGPDGTGLSRITYIAQTLITSRQTVTATATAIDGAKAQTQITLVPPAITVQVNPATVTLTGGQTQLFTASVFGISSTGVTWSISPLVGSINPNSGLYVAPSAISTTQKITVTATSTFDTNVSGAASLTLQAPTTVSVTVSPSSASLTNGESQQFTATVQNAASNAVAWSISPQLGTIDSSGLYTAPALISSSTKVTLTATSVSDPTKSGAASITISPLVDVGAGAPTSTIQSAFIAAFNRLGLVNTVVLPPLGLVKANGTAGYLQEFTDARDTSQKDALVTASATVGANVVVQVLAPLYAYYSTVGSGTAGYPLADSQGCPASGNPCTYAFFDKGYALFSYSTSLTGGQNFSVSGTNYTEWTNLGGISGLGAPVSEAITITASSATTAAEQDFTYGAIFSITSGTYKGKIFGVAAPVYDLYVTQGGAAGPLGLPIGEAALVATGVYKQSFEGGVLQYTSGGGGPVVQLPVKSVSLSGGPSSGNTTLNLGQTLTLTAIPVATDGTVLTDRPVSWSTTNSKVISIQASGATAVITAVGRGSASILAATQGVSSQKVTFVVIAPCCQVGDGAPASVQQSFQDALTRNKVAVQLPVSSPAARVGSGYVQMVQSASTDSPAVFMLAKPDQLGTAFLVAGALLARYQAFSGPGGDLGYPVSDASGGGTQLFAGGALAGSPVRIVTGLILARWAALGYENGGAGLPVSDVAAFSTFAANSGLSQEFAKGVIYAATAGPRSGQVYLVSGLIRTRYDALGGAAGDLGMPTSDEFVNAGIHQQNFESGNLTYSAGDSAAVEHPSPKVPGIVVAPSSITAGGRARLAVLGFPNNSTIRVSVTGRPDFVVNSANGSYTWDISAPLGARSAALSIHAVDTQGPASADGTLTIKGFTENRVQISKLQGDNQTAVPGALIPVSLRIAVLDSAGAPVVGAPVVFQPSPGARVTVSSAITDSSGRAETFLRLPPTEGIAAVTVESPSVAQVPVTFYARSAGSTLSNFPKLIQAGDAPLGNGTETIAKKGALLTAAASILRYRQNRGELSAPNGTADSATLNQFLKSYCSVDVEGNPLCDGFLTSGASGEQIVNLWRAAEFTGGVDVTALEPTAATLSDLVAQGSPVLVSLGLNRNAAPAGGHFVVAIGVAADGSILIQDPNPFFGRTNLGDYFSGFSAGGATWQGDVRGVVHFALRSPSATRFLVGALSQPSAVMSRLVLNVQSSAGPCGVPFDAVDSVDGAGSPPPGGPLVSRLQVCDGLQSAYQINIGTSQAFRAFVTDLASAGASSDLSGAGLASYKVVRQQLSLLLARQDAGFTSTGVVNAATFTTGIAPGGLMSIFGTGLAGAGTATAVDMDGIEAAVISVSPFQINAQVPSGVQPGNHTLHIHSAYGDAQQPVVVSAVAPRIFLIGTPPIGAVVNQDNSINTPSAPLTRGQMLVIYATGLGAVNRQGQLSVVAAPVTAILNGQELPVAFSGLTPGYIGLYQVNLPIPAATPPGLGISLTLKQGGVLSNTISVALQ